MYTLYCLIARLNFHSCALIAIATQVMTGTAIGSIPPEKTVTLAH